MSGPGLTRLELCLSLAGPFVPLAVAGALGGLGAIVVLVGALGGLGIAAAALGVDSRDGDDWRRDRPSLRRLER